MINYKHKLRKIKIKNDYYDYKSIYYIFLE